MNHSLPLIISAGDPAGVGPLVSLLGAAALAGDAPVTIVGDAAQLRDLIATFDLSPSVTLVDVGPTPRAAIEARAPTPDGGKAQLRALDTAIAMVREGKGRALITAPVSKDAITQSGTHFTGHTEYLAAHAGLQTDEVTMIFSGPRLRVGLVTTHVAIDHASREVTAARVYRTIRHMAEALRREFPRGTVQLAVTGLNPHAGERGLFGDEERATIGPAVDAARRELATGDPDLRIVGPLGAETAFRKAADGTYQGVVAMLHDQATIASKLLDWQSAVNVTWGLPFVRTSVDHGVAYDAVAHGDVDARGMTAALRMAMTLSRPSGAHP